MSCRYIAIGIHFGEIVPGGFNCGAWRIEQSWIESILLRYPHWKKNSEHARPHVHLSLPHAVLLELA